MSNPRCVATRAMKIHDPTIFKYFMGIYVQFLWITYLPIRLDIRIKICLSTINRNLKRKVGIAVKVRKQLASL